MMTDKKIKDAVAAYIISGHEDDNADCLHERDEWQGEDAQDALRRAYELYRTAIVTVTWGDE